jgi:hypothetical protein
VERHLSSGQAASAHLSARVQFLAEEPLTVASVPPEPETSYNAPPDDTPVTPEPPSASDTYDGGSTTRLDRNGQPMDTPPVVVQDEVLTDQGSQAPPPAVRDEPATQMPDFTQPRSPGELLGSSTTQQDGLDYTFALYRKDNGKYMFLLTVTNNGGAPVELRFDTNEKFDFTASAGGAMTWNYNNNRFYVQSPQSETIEPYANDPNNALEYKAEWDGSPNPTGDTTSTIGRPLPKGTYHFEAIHQLSGSPVRLSFDATLE